MSEDSRVEGNEKGTDKDTPVHVGVLYTVFVSRLR